VPNLALSKEDRVKRALQSQEAHADCTLEIDELALTEAEKARLGYNRKIKDDLIRHG